MSRFTASAEVAGQIRQLGPDDRDRLLAALRDLTEWFQRGEPVATIPNVQSLDGDLYELQWLPGSRAVFRVTGSAAEPERRTLELLRLRVTPSPTVSQPSAARFQLPPDVSDFTDREAEVRELERLLEAAGAPGATSVVAAVVTGIAGVGKTALAVHVAHRVRRSFPDGQLFVDLRSGDGSRRPSQDVLAELLQALGVAGTAVPEQLEQQTRSYRHQLTDRRVLLVLDDAVDEAQVRPLLPGSAGCGVLITSRALLAGLEGARLLDLDILTPEWALALLERMIGTGRLERERAAAEEIVARCGYLPLAVRIAGGRLAGRPSWSLATLARLLADERYRLGELRAGDRAVRASIALGYREQPEEAQRAFRLLGLLWSPSFPTWVAAAVLDRAIPDATELVERLVDAQLIEALHEDELGQARYGYHDLLRLFAREEAEADQERQAALDRGLRAYLAAARQAAALLTPEASASPGASPTAGIPDVATSPAKALLGDPVRWFESERVSLVAAVLQAYDARLWSLTWQLADAIGDYLSWADHWGDWRRTQELALRAAQNDRDPKAEADALRSLGELAWKQNRWSEAASQLEASLVIFREHGDLRGEAQTLHTLTRVQVSSGRPAKALAQLEQCLGLFRRLGDRVGEVRVLRTQAGAYRLLGRPSDAARVLEDCLAKSKELGDRPGEARAFRRLGAVYGDLGRFSEGTALLEQGLVMLRDLRDRLGEAYALISLGELALDAGRPGDALLRFEEALAIVGQVGDRVGEQRALRGLGTAQRRLGRLDEAATTLHKAKAQAETLADRLGEAYTLVALGELDRERMRFDEARACFERARDVLEQVGDRIGEGRALRGLGQVLMDQEHRDDAERYLREALAHFRAAGSPDAEGVEQLLAASADGTGGQ
jgi:tetratricopeptide (TPR) repeat protein